MWPKLPLGYHHIASADNGWVKAAVWMCLIFVAGIFNRIGLGHSESLHLSVNYRVGVSLLV